MNRDRGCDFQIATASIEATENQEWVLKQGYKFVRSNSYAEIIISTCVPIDVLNAPRVPILS